MSAGRIRLVPPRESLIEAVAGLLPSGGRDLSRSWIVFPERRPAYYLRKHLAGRIGAGFIPPRIFSLDAFTDFVYGESLGLRNRPIDVLDAVAILLGIQRSAPGRLGGERFLTADHFFPPRRQALSGPRGADRGRLHRRLLEGERARSRRSRTRSRAPGED